MIVYSKLTLRLIAAWFVLALSASALHLIQTPATKPPLPLGIAVLLPLLIFITWYGVSATFREFCLGLDRSVLTMVQSWRIAGFVFLVLYSYHILPGLFALPAGWGDILIGMTAPFVARNWSTERHRAFFVAWQCLGVLDLVLAIGLGSTANLIHPDGVATGAMTVLPMSLIPTFAVPLLLILHFISIAQALKKTSPSGLMFQRPSMA